MIHTPAPSRAPDPPARFRGSFIRTGRERSRVAVASGPVRIRPLAVAHPTDVDDLVELVVWAGRQGVPLVPRGGGTGMPGGNVGDGVVVDLTHWDALGDVDPEARRVRAGPGVRASRLDEQARAAGLFLPALPSSADRCTLGGMVANNAAGARSFRHGSIRPWVAALDVVLADGSRTTLAPGALPDPAFADLHATLLGRLGPEAPGWPSVRKNSSGYALDRFLPSADPAALLVGSEGTLGIVTDVELHLAPQPDARALVLMPVVELDDVVAVTREADLVGAEACEFFASSFIRIAGLEADPEVGAVARDAAALVLVELAGPADVVEAGIDAMRSLASTLGVDTRVARDAEARHRLWSVRHAASPIVAGRAAQGLISMQFIEDSVVPPDGLVAYLRSLESILAEEDTEAVMFGHAGDGNVHVNPLIDVRRRGWKARVRRILEGTVKLVARLGGTLSGEHGDGRIRAPFIERIWGPTLAGAFTEVKRTLDPQGILNPGVIVPVPGQDPLAGLGSHRRAAS